MFGGPWLGVLVFVVIAIAMGWGVTKFFKAMGEFNAEMGLRLDDSPRHDFDPEQVYLLQRDLLLGYLADGRVTLFPSHDDLPAHAPGRKRVPTIEQFRDRPTAYPDLIGVVERHTRVRFVEVIEDPDNQQTALLVLVRIIDGPHAAATPVLGMHLESTDIKKNEIQDIDLNYDVPNPALFAPVEPAASPVQSQAPGA